MEETGCSSVVVVAATASSPQSPSSASPATVNSSAAPSGPGTAATAAPVTSGSSTADIFHSPPRTGGPPQQPSATTPATAAGVVVAGVAAASPAGPAQPAPAPSQPARILSRNANGTVVQTSMPQNEAELQLYRVMQRASLLNYYDTLLEMGGDDVQQLCDAGEEEFLEIMALVGMASKPLHVRRLQKALQEWLTNPVIFQTPVIVPGSGSSAPVIVPKPTPSSLGFSCVSSYSPGIKQQLQLQHQQQQQQQQQQSTNLSSAVGATSLLAGNTSLAAAHAPVKGPPSSSSTGAVGLPVLPLLGQFSSSSSCCSLQRHKSLSPPVSVSALGFPSVHGPLELPANSTSSASAAAAAAALPLSHSPGLPQTGNYESSSCGSQGTTPSPGGNSATGQAPPSPTLGLQTTPVLLECQVQRLAEAAERLASTIRPLNPKPPSGIKKKMCRNLEMVMAMPDSDPRRMEEIRKYAAIYGRFDCKRKPEKPLTLHEVSVNEAAAQICRFVPALLTRRDELFPLARRVVRDSGHYYTKGLLLMPSSRTSRENGDGGDLSGGDETSNSAEDAAKRRRLHDDQTARDTAGMDALQQQSRQQSQQQTESTRIRLCNYSRSVTTCDSEAYLHRKRQRRHRASKLFRRSTTRLGSLTISPVWQSCSDNSNLLLDEVAQELDHHSDGCYSSFDEEWDDDYNDEDDCPDQFGIDADEAMGNDANDEHGTMHNAENSTLQDDDASAILDKENDFNLKVIASCGDNIIAVANPALMNHNPSAAISKDQSIKEEIVLRDRRD